MKKKLLIALMSGMLILGGCGTAASGSAASEASSVASVSVPEASDAASTVAASADTESASAVTTAAAEEIASPTSESSSDVTTDDAVEETSPQDPINEVKAAAENGIGEGESVTDVILENGVLTISVDLSGADTSLLSLDDIAYTRVGSITDEVLDLDDVYDLWNTIILDFGLEGTATFDKSEVEDGPVGRYFDYQDDVLKK